ncbi:MAG: threonine--tRNA ligase [bacterium]|nr:threonine--tRNA ligase [bacterium]
MEGQKNLETLRHSTSHVMAAAIKKLYPDVKYGIGPAVENGFYYDLKFQKSITPDDLGKIEKNMEEIIKADLPFEKSEITKAKAKELFHNQPFKLELIDDLPEEKVSIYTIGDFTDLCAGPHVKKTSEINAYKLLSIAGAYWHGDERNTMLTRIYGTAFPNLEELEKYIHQLSEAEKRDHRKLGRELGLFVFSDLVGPGLPLYTPKGTEVRRLIVKFSTELREKIGYQFVHTQQINKAELFKISGHYDKYKDDMLKVTSHYTNEEYYLKPMNCPQHTQIYASSKHSYKDLPIRYADFANLYRDEKPGELNGLARLRGFSQDDGHCFCREDQISEEFSKLLDVVCQAMKRYSMEYYIRLSLRDEENKANYIGTDDNWQKSQKILERLLAEKKIDYIKAPGEAAFYGPKMDLMAKDAIGREWQLSTIQLDFNMPQRFKLEYTGQDGKQYTPVLIHSAIAGSPERFMGILIEHFAGAFPFWLAPIQMQVVPVSEKNFDFACKVYTKLINQGIRVDVDMSNETLGKKIRNAELQKIPYILVIGPKEAEKSTKDELYISVRSREKGDIGAMAISQLLEEALR